MDIAIDFVKDKVDNKKLMVNLVLFLLKQKSLKALTKKNSDIKNLFFSCIKRVFNMKNIQNKLKDEIKKRLIKNFNEYCKNYF